MKPAELVIKKFGGVRALAKLVGVYPGTVSRWTAPKERNGTGGYIPVKYHRLVLELADQHGKNLTLEELCFGRENS